MAQEITGDPVTNLSAWNEGRHIFSSQEDDIADLLNKNMRKSVDLTEEFEGEISTLQSEMDTAQQNISDNASDISTLQSKVADRLKDSKYDRLLSALQVCKTDGSAGSGDTSLSVTPTQMALLSGDDLAAFDPASGVVQTITVDADASQGSTTLTVQALSSDIDDERVLLIDRNSSRDADAVTAVNNYLNNEESTDLKSLAQAVSSNESTLNGLSSSLSDLTTEVGEISARANSIQGELESVRGTVQTLEGEVQLGVTSRVAADQELGYVNSTNLDGSQTDEIPFDGLITTLNKDDYLLVFNDSEGTKYLVQIKWIGSSSNQKDTWDPFANGTSATIKLQQQHPLNLPDGSPIYLAPVSIRSEVSVVKDEVALRVKKDNMVSELKVQLDNITTKTDIFKSSNYDGAVDRSGTLAKPGVYSGGGGGGGGSDDNISTGTAGWALFENGAFIANNAYFRGDVQATTGEFSGGIEMKGEAKIQNTGQTYALTRAGYDIYAASGGASASRFFGLWDKGNETFLGGLAADLSGSRPTVLLDAAREASAELTVKSKKRAKLASLHESVELVATQGRIRFQSDEIVMPSPTKASGVSDLENNVYSSGDPPRGLVWVNTSQNNRVEWYDTGGGGGGGTINVDPSLLVGEAYGTEQQISITDYSTVDGTTIDSWEVDWGDNNTESGNGDVGFATHTYNDGTYDITYTVWDAQNNQYQTTVTGVEIPTSTANPLDPPDAVE